MNLVKAADDIKNLSDQQLISAGQNPVMIPPYLVLAEMKRREQLRAEFAKAQQQPQPSVAQQVAQNLVQPQQGQSQQGMQQAPPQGIMQAAPPQAQAMAGGGIVGRYEKGGDTAGGAPSYAEQYQSALKMLAGLQGVVPKEPEMEYPVSIDEINKRYPSVRVQDRISAAKELLGAQDYSQYENFLREQMTQARAKKPSVGDALIAAGSAMASNRDNRVGLANLLAQAIGTGSESYRAQQEKAKKDMQTAMLAQVAFNKMKQEDINKQVELASQIASGERGENIVKWQFSDAARRDKLAREMGARTAQQRINAEAIMKQAELTERLAAANQAQQARSKEGELTRQTQLDIARIQNSSKMGSAADRERNAHITATAKALDNVETQVKELQASQKMSPKREDRNKLQEQIKELEKTRNKLRTHLTGLGGIQSVVPTGSLYDQQD